MRKAVFTIILCLGCVAFSIAQPSLNDYKYIIVPNQYNFQKEPDLYQLNSLTKFLFNKHGFTALLQSESFTDELVKNKCLALNARVINESGLFKTKLSIELRNCRGEVVFLSQTGETREKDYAKAFNLALRNAFESFESVSYSYTPNNEKTAIASTTITPEQEEVEKLKEEIESLKREKEAQVEVAAKAEENEMVETESGKAVVVSATAVTVKENEKPETIEAMEQVAEVQTEVSDVLYAQAIDGGYQLVDSSPKVVYKIKKSSLENTFFVEGQQAILVKKDSSWVLEYYEGNVLKKKTLNIKF